MSTGIQVEIVMSFVMSFASISTCLQFNLQESPHIIQNSHSGFGDDKTFQHIGQAADLKFESKS